MSIFDFISTLFEDNAQNVAERKHKILMMGGRRSGKSTILSSILFQLKDKTPGDVCTIIDKTDYTQQLTRADGQGSNIPTLDIKRNELHTFLENKNLGSEFIVDMTPTYGQSTYILEISANNTSVELEFVDIPGEWMRAGVPEHRKLRELVKQSDVFVIAIDTPFLMNTETYAGQCINNVYNRIDEIAQLMSHMIINSPSDLKQIILCPVKCERWIYEDKIDNVITKIKQAYKNLINRWVSQDAVSIQIMPIHTAGGLIFSRMLPAKLYFTDNCNRTGLLCSENPETHDLIDYKGNLIERQPGDSVIDDQNYSIDYISIPLSWYKTNGYGYRPQYCEQPGLHILKFLVEKEEKVNSVKAAAQRNQLNNTNPIWRFLTQIFRPTFGEHLPVWENVIEAFDKQELIKTDGDGFCHINAFVK